MPEFLEQQPGLLYVVATLLPLASFVLLLLVGAIRCYVHEPRGVRRRDDLPTPRR